MTLSAKDRVLIQTGEFLALIELAVYILPIFTLVPALAGGLPLHQSIIFLSATAIVWYTFMYFTIDRLSDWLYPYVHRLAVKEIEWRRKKYGTLG